MLIRTAVSDALPASTRAASTGELKDLKRQARDLKEVVAERALELRLLKKHDRRWGEDT